MSATPLSGVGAARTPDALKGIGMMVLGVFVFAGSNVLAKLVMVSFPVGETLFVRCGLTLLMLAPFIRRRDIATTRAAGRGWLHLLRMGASVVDSSGYYLAVSVLPLADVSAIYLASPIYVTGLSALFLGERVGWRRWSAVLAGFVGVLIALRPGGATLSVYALAALVGSLAYAAMNVSTRRLRGVPNTVLVFTQVAALFVAAMVTAPGWVWPTAVQSVQLALVALISMGGFLCTNRGLQLAMASVVAPFQYSSIIWAVLLGWAVFGDIPGPPVLAGSAVIIAAGLFIALRERRLGKG